MDMHDPLNRNEWFAGQLMAFSAIDGPTDHAQGLVARTICPQGRPGLQMVLPGKCSVLFPGTANQANRVTGDAVTLECATGAVRGVFLDAYHFLVDGPCEVAATESAIALGQAGGRTLIGSASRFDAALIHADIEAAIQARNTWLRRRVCLPDVSVSAPQTLAKMLSVMKTQVCSPEGLIRHRWTTPDRWPHRHMWLWDSVFHAIGWRHLDVPLAREMLEAVLDAQRADGFVAHMATPANISEVTQPPLLGLGVKLVNDVSPDLAWVASLYPRLCAYIEWDRDHRDSDGAGLVEWAISGNSLCRSDESGMDNSPRFDTAKRLDAVDFNSYLALECEILAGFAAQIGLPDDAEKWSARHRTLCERIRERLWSEQHGFFLDYDVERGEPSPVLASAGFLPLICGAPSPGQAAQLAACLRDPNLFGAPFPVPSIAIGDGEHYAGDMWRGPVWININWLIVYGFERYGMRDVAGKLRRQSLRAMEKYENRFGVAFEFYDARDAIAPPALLRKGTCDPESVFHQVIDDYGWTAALYVDLTEQETCATQ